MQTTVTAGPADNSGAASALPPNQSASPPKFIDFAELSRHVPLCERSLREAIRRGHIPSVRLAGMRRNIFHLESVMAALLRVQKWND